MPRRKTLKKTEVSQFSNCMEEAAAAGGGWQAFFPFTGAPMLELGCGTARFSMEMARRHPAQKVVAIDAKPARLWRPAKTAIESGMGNILFLNARLERLEGLFGPATAGSIWITFPDPFPKPKQSKHRMINPPFLAQYRRILQPGGLLHFKTDDLPLFHYALEVFVREKDMRFHALQFDLHEGLPAEHDARILTAYEEKFIAQGMKIYYAALSFGG